MGRSQKRAGRLARHLGALLLVGALGPAVAAAAPNDVGVVWDNGPGGERYVALGDSAASGPGILNQRQDPLACERSDRNFPTLVANRLDVRAFRDVTCSSATTAHFADPQENPNNIPGVNPPQFDALSPDTTLVTLGPIGANDFNLVGVGIGCINPAPPDSAGTSCKDTYTADGTDPNVETIDGLYPKLTRILRQVHKRAPQARVFIVGYGQYFPVSGCWPYVPVWPEDADYIQSLVDRIDAVLARVVRRDTWGKRRAARKAGRRPARYVSLQGNNAVAHTMCAAPAMQWITQLTDPLSGNGIIAHPTARGMAAFGRIVTHAIRGSSTGKPASSG